MLKNQSIIIKQAVQAGIILLFLLITGIIGFLGLSIVVDKMDTIQSTSFQTDASKEMGNAVSQDLTTAMILIHADSEKVLEESWKQHQAHVREYDKHVKQLLESIDSAYTKSGSQSLLQMKKRVEQADTFHDKALQPQFQKVYDEVAREIRLREQLSITMDQLESVYNQLIELAEDFEMGVKARIRTRIGQGATADSILGRENTWADMAMEMKATLSQSRIAVEEYVQSMESDSLSATEAEFNAAVNEFNGWISALLNGADTAEGKISRVNVAGIRQMVLDIQKLDRETYQPAAREFMKLQQELIAAGQRKQAIVERAEQTAKQMAEQLVEIERLASNNMHMAEKEARDAAVNADILILMAIVLSFVISIVFVVIISRGISRPLRQAVKFAEAMSGGDFTKTLVINQRDEVGQLAESLKQMVSNLSRMIQKTHSGVTTLSATSAELSTLSEVMATSAESTAEKSTTVASASEEMNANVESVAAAMEEATTNVNNIAAAVEEMNANFSEIMERIKQTQDNTQKAARVTEDSSSVVAELGRAASEIGTIAETINTIADKTSLLALNATIEAARAGDAGKGFAVVAGEIKGLARQVSESTSDISKKLSAIQDATQSTVNGINEITGVIVQVNDSVESINTSMEQQNYATQEISENISQTSSGLKEINDNVSQTSQAVAQVNQEISDVNKEAQEISSSSSEVQLNAEKLMSLSSQLEEQVAEFKTADARFTAGPAKLAHAKWKQKLADLLAGRLELQVSDIISHHDCEFGQWYFGQGKALFSTNSTFQKIDLDHKKVHEMAREITDLYNRGKNKEAIALYQKYNSVTKDLFDLLDQLEEEVRSAGND